MKQEQMVTFKMNYDMSPVLDRQTDECTYHILIWGIIRGDTTLGIIYPELSNIIYI